LKAGAAGLWYLSTKLKNMTSQKTVILTQKLPTSSPMRKIDTDEGNIKWILDTNVKE
jgi:hypothetical protein